MIAAKTAEPHPKLPGTIYTAAEEGELPFNSKLFSQIITCVGEGSPSSRERNHH